MTASAPDSVDIRRKVECLSQPAAYGEEATAVEVLQTHMSWLFLTRRHVYKLKKPLQRAFLDFSTVEARHHNCQEELRLNRELAGDVYLEVLPLTIDGAGRLGLAAGGEPIDWLVKMQRLPRDRMLDVLASQGRVATIALRRIAARLVEFYQRTAKIEMSPQDYRERFRRDIEANQAELRRAEFRLPASAVDEVCAAQLDFVARSAGALEERAAAGRILEAHGDLRPEHICVLDGVVCIDRLEFNRAFRLLDPVDELAFLAMECESAGAAYIGRQILDAYFEMTSDAPAAALVRFYRSYRAALRAKISIWHQDDHPAAEHTKWRERALGYLALAARYVPGA